MAAIKSYGFTFGMTPKVWKKVFGKPGERYLEVQIAADSRDEMRSLRCSADAVAGRNGWAHFGRTEEIGPTESKLYAGEYRFTKRYYERFS